MITWRRGAAGADLEVGTEGRSGVVYLRRVDNVSGGHHQLMLSVHDLRAFIEEAKMGHWDDI